MQSILPETLVILALLLANGFFSMSETALISARKTRLRELAEGGDRKAGRALALAERPDRFLSAVQVGITLITILQGAAAGENMKAQLSGLIARIEPLAQYADRIAFSLVVVAITLASVVIGELVPKRVALANPDGIARAVAGPIGALTRGTSFVVHGLSAATDMILKLFGLGQSQVQSVSEGEINDLVQQGLRTGAFNPTETEMVAGVLQLDQLGVTSIMTPRPKMVFLNLDDPDEVNWRKIVTSGHSRYPVYAMHRDQVVGVVTVKAMWANTAFGLPANLRSVMSPPLIVPESMTVIHLIEQFRKTGQHLALVTDEFGAIQGLVTMIDIMEAIAGDLPEKGRRAAPEARKREDGSWLIDATLLAPEFKELLGIEALPHEETAEFKTAGGFVMTYFGRIPRAGDHFDLDRWRIEVIDMDRHRIDKILATPIPKDPDEEDSADEDDETRG